MSMLSLQTVDRNPELASVQIVFSLTEDRWTHAIQLRLKNEIVLIAESVEGLPADDWPASPVLQEIAEHEIGNQTALLGVGMAGGSHWSLSASVHESQKVLLDIACLVNQKRMGGPIGWLGSTYQLVDGVQIVSATKTKIKLTVVGLSIEFRAVSEEDWGSWFSVDGDRITAIPTRVSKRSTQSTRWGLGVGFSEKQTIAASDNRSVLHGP